METEDASVFTALLDRLGDTPTRAAFVTLVASDRFWAGVVVLLPVTQLVATRIHGVFVPFAAGVSIGLCLALV